MHFWNKNTALFFFCNILKETPVHIFSDCIHVNCLWERLQTNFQKNFVLSSLTVQTAILGTYNKASDNCNLLRYVLLIFKFYIYISIEKRLLNIDILIGKLMKVKKVEKQISLNTSSRTETAKK